MAKAGIIRTQCRSLCDRDEKLTTGKRKMGFRNCICSVVTVVSFLSSTASGQSSTSLIAPAEAVVTNPSASLLGAETLQLTENVFDTMLNNKVTNEFAHIFAFESNDTLSKRQSASCKTYPGDRLWPSKLVWGVFDLLLGRRLLATEPIASPCYDSVWGAKNPAECNALVGRFTKATTQCVANRISKFVFFNVFKANMTPLRLCGPSSKEKPAWPALTLQRLVNAHSGGSQSMQSTYLL